MAAQLTLTPEQRQRLLDLCNRANSARYMKESRGGSLDPKRPQEALAIQDLAEYRDCVTPELVAGLVADLVRLDRAVNRLCEDHELRDIVAQQPADTRRDRQQWREWALEETGWRYLSQRREQDGTAAQETRAERRQRTPDSGQVAMEI
jgi:hypothetical protein